MPKSRYINILVTASTALILLLNTVSATENTTWYSGISGFVSATGGIYILSFPDIEPPDAPVDNRIRFDDVYGSKNGLSFGGEAGLGLADIGLFGVVRYRIWKKSGQPVMADGAQFYGDMEWSQTFVTLGARYFLVNLMGNHRPLIPFIGGGMIHSEATESVNGVINFLGSVESLTGEIHIDGAGFYIECGSDYNLTPALSLCGVFEYSNLHLGVCENGPRIKTKGGGGIFIGVMLNAFIGRSMDSSRIVVCPDNNLIAV